MKKIHVPGSQQVALATVLVTLKKEVKMKVSLVQQILEEDFDRLVLFCEIIMFLTKVTFSDQSFFLSGHINHQTC